MAENDKDDSAGLRGYVQFAVQQTTTGIDHLVK